MDAFFPNASFAWFGAIVLLSIHVLNWKWGYATALISFAYIGFLYSLGANTDLIKLVHPQPELGIMADVFVYGLFYVFIAFAVGELEKNRIEALNEITHLNKQLEVEKDKAVDVARLKTEFLANMSHEIRTPMNGVLGMADLLSQADLSEEHKLYLETICNSSEMLQSILNDVLDFSKMESQKLNLVYEPFDLKKCIEETLVLYKGNAIQKGIKLDLIVDDDIPQYIYGDSIRYKQILSNLVNNAIKFTESGGVKVLVSLKPDKSKEQNILTVSVKDTGCGISEKNLQKLFTPFTQADSSITRNFGGTGLGLSICYGLLNLMNGKIYAKSQINEGSEFVFEIPITKAKIIKHLKKDRVNELDKNLSYKTLIVEDNPVNQMVLSKMLQNFGLTPDKVNSGLDAIQQAQRNNYDIIFMDCHMPGISGFEASEKIKKLKLKKDPLIIAVTADVFNENRQRCIQSGMSKFITKPVRYEVLKELLAEFSTNSDPKNASSKINQA